MVLVQKWPYFRQFLQPIQARKMYFTIFQNEQTPFQAVKTISSKSVKIDIFSKGLIHGFCPKNEHISNFFFQAIWARIMSFTIFQNKKTPFQAIKKNNFNGRKIDILPKGLTHALGPKMANFLLFFFQGIQARIMSFTIFQNEKTPFQAIRKTSSNG